MCGIGFCLGVALTPPVRAQVIGVPISDQVVLGSLRLKNGTWANFRAREGSMVSVQESGQTIFFGFVSQILGQDNVKILPFAITDLPDDGQRDRQRADEIPGKAAAVRKGGQVEIDSDGFEIGITFSGVTTGHFLSPVVEDPGTLTPMELWELYGTKSGEFCCLTCGGVTVCADGVSMSCGSCFSEGGGRRLPV